MSDDHKRDTSTDLLATLNLLDGKFTGQWVQHRLARHLRCHVPFAPTSISGPGPIECWFREITEKGARRGQSSTLLNSTGADYNRWGIVLPHCDSSEFNHRPTIANAHSSHASFVGTTPGFGPRGRPPQYTLFCLLLILLLGGSRASEARPASQQSCGNSGPVLDLLQQGSDDQRPSVERRKAYEQAIQICPGDPALYNGLAVLLLQHQEFRPALHWIRRGLQIAPHDLNLTLSYGIAQLCAGDPEEALSVLRRLSPTGKTQFYLGMAYRALRDHKAAQEAFSKAFGMGYEDPYVLYALIEQDRALRDKGAGLRDFRTFCERFPNSAWLHLLLADAYASRHDAANAETEYTQALNLNPNLPIVHFQLGRLALNRTAYSAAQEEFTKEMVLNPSFGEAYLYEGVTLRQQGKNREALPFLEEAVKRDPNSALPYRELSAAQVEANQLEAALRTLRVGEERFPHEAAFPAQLASLLKRVGRSQEAKKEAELAEALSRESNPGLPFLFDVAVAPQGPTAKAEATSVKADETEPSSFTAGSGLFQRPAPEDFEASDATTANVGATQHVNPALAQLLECLRRADAKCSTTALAQIRDPKLEDDPEYLDLAAQALSLQHRRVQALDAIRRAIEKDPKQARYFMTQGWIYQKFGDQVSAIRSFLNAERLEPRSPVPYYSLGVSFFAVGYFYSDPVYYARAEQRFKTALELDPLYDKAEFMLGVIDAVNSRLTEAKQHLEETLKMKPFNPIYHLHYGILLNRLGDNASSLREMKMAEELDPYYALTHLNLGSLYSRIRSYEEARNELEKAIELDPHLGSAYYLLGGVYHHLGLNDKSARAYEHFEQAKQRSRKDTTDALENTISSPGPGFAPEYR